MKPIHFDNSDSITMFLLALHWHAFQFLYLQVMYDASGVRLHAGRQAEVSHLGTFM